MTLFQQNFLAVHTQFPVWLLTASFHITQRRCINKTKPDKHRQSGQYCWQGPVGSQSQLELSDCALCLLYVVTFYITVFGHCVLQYTKQLFFMAMICYFILEVFSGQNNSPGQPCLGPSDMQPSMDGVRLNLSRSLQFPPALVIHFISTYLFAAAITKMQTGYGPKRGGKKR